MFSLIVATLNRVDELDRLLTSLDAQDCRQFEVLIVDQNSDDRLTPVLQRHPGLSVQHLSSSRGLSRGRNLGLSRVTGEIIAIPDDDCWYPPNLLVQIAAWFASHPEFGVLSVIKKSADNTPVGPNWPRSAQEVTRKSVWHSAISSTIFMRRKVVESVGLFNEDIGVGCSSRYQSGEETEYLLRAMRNGFRIWYEPSLTVHHPNLHSIERLREKTYPYALGAGYVLRIHGYSWVDFAEYVVRSVGGAVVSLGKGDISMSQLYLLRAAGQLRGYFWGPRDLARYHAQSH
jgi:glycosyltransferase involved in cell wall biosynthesis